MLGDYRYKDIGSHEDAIQKKSLKNGISQIKKWPKIKTLMRISTTDQD